MNESKTQSAAGLAGIVVVEISGSIAGAHAAMLLFDRGATVVVVEPPGGSPMRRDPAQWLAWCAYRDQYVTLDSEEANNWIARADVVIESNGSTAVRSVVAGLRDDAVHVVITPFGSTGPYAHWQSADIIDQAIGGHLYLSGTPDREPLQGPSGQAALAAGIWAAIGVVSALYARRRLRRSGERIPGEVIEVSHQEALASLHQFTDVRYTHGHDVLRRMGNRYAGPGSPIGMYRASDGWVAFTVATAAHGELLLALTDNFHLLELPGIDSVLDVMMNASILDPALNAWLATQTVESAVELLQSARIAVGPVYTMQQLLADQHLEARQWWRHIDGERELVQPGAPTHIDSVRWRSVRSTLGGPFSEATAEAEVAVEGVAQDSDLAAGVAREDLNHLPASANLPGGFAAEHVRQKPLVGVRVLDLTRVWAGPLAARVLADLGADVVMVEAPSARMPLSVPESYVHSSKFFPGNISQPDPWNRNGFINKFALGKRSVSLDLSNAKGREAFLGLVGGSDMVIENYSPRVMPNLGLGEEELHTRNPSLIYMTMPGYGRTGPCKDYSAYGPVIDSHAGLSTLMGYPETDAWKCGIAWPDPVGGIHGAFAALVALWERDRTPERPGTTIEVAQFESAVTMVGEHLLRAQITGENPPIRGNRHPDFAPQGVYRCEGDDRWVACVVESDSQWLAMCELLGAESEWREWSVAARRQHHDQIDLAIGEWCAARSPQEAAVALQEVGIAAAPVANAHDLLNDPQLIHTEFYRPLTHTSTGTQLWHRLPLQCSHAQASPVRAAPLLGEHSGQVFHEWAGQPASYVEALLQDGVLHTRPLV